MGNLYSRRADVNRNQAERNVDVSPYPIKYEENREYTTNEKSITFLDDLHRMLPYSTLVYDYPKIRTITGQQGDKVPRTDVNILFRTMKMATWIEGKKRRGWNICGFGNDGKELEERFIAVERFVRDDQRMTDIVTGGNTKVKDMSQLVDFNDCKGDVKSSSVYGIIVDHHFNQVVVVFRGSTSIYDWFNNFRVKMKDIDVPGIDGKVGLHSGFVKILDLDKPPSNSEATLPRKVDEILAKVKEILNEQKENGHDYTLALCGHSMAGANATLLGFYAASDPEWKFGRVTVYSFSSPRVGDIRFRDRFTALEKEGKLRHARIHSKRDIVPMVPYELGGSYYHVGMELKVMSEPKVDFNYPCDRFWLQQNPPMWERIVTLPAALQFHKLAKIMERMARVGNDLQKKTLDGEYSSLKYES